MGKNRTLGYLGIPDENVHCGYCGHRRIAHGKKSCLYCIYDNQGSECKGFKESSATLPKTSEPKSRKEDKAVDKRIAGPYFVVGTNIYRHWPDSTQEAICDGEKQYGPDFVDHYSTRKAAQKDADTMNRANAKKVEA